MKALTSRYGILCLLFIVLMVLNLNSIVRADTAQGLRAASQATVLTAEALRTNAAPLVVSKTMSSGIAPVLTGGQQKNVEATDDVPIAINQLDAAGLAKAMKGIGPKKAEAIVEFRTVNGPFMDVEELLNVSGIGERILQMNAGRLQL
ncbi:helix-hairpin-helix domain-containing protein [Allohahella marinimesophila]|uniref:Helix-hairpin-helix DNA-binding motif class 1 domain-containing protein n=1 Tax=Allohahella marinimesophila TaxID=1054972 RepID=A0ABP7P4J3_9GAMM